MLYVPQYAGALTAQTNSWSGAVLSSSLGTSVTPGTADYGSWAAAGSALTSDAYGIRINCHDNCTNGAFRTTCLTLGYDPAGGTSYSDLINDMLVGSAGSVTGGGGGGPLEFYFPIFIPSGSTIAFKAYGDVASTLRAACQVYRCPVSPESLKVGTFVETIGATAPTGTAVTAGSTAEGSWTLIGTTSVALWYWQVGLGQTAAGAGGGKGYAVDLAVGTGGNYNVIIEEQHFQEDSAERLADMGCRNPASYYPVPAGSSMYVRVACSSIPSGTLAAVVYGVG